MILAIDTYYFATSAKTVALLINNWTDEKPADTIEHISHTVNPYVPGEFYKRELPCITALLEKVNLDTVETIIIDGYVVLDDSEKPGLGAYLYEFLNKKYPVIGVAKTKYHSISKLQQQVLRGNSASPLYITALGIDLQEAGDKIKSMSGAYRIPALLKQLDSFTRILLEKQ